MPRDDPAPDGTANRPTIRFGESGRLALDADADRLQCHLCGRWFRHLAQHALRGHGLGADDYRALAGLNRQTRLVSPGHSAKIRTWMAPLIAERRAAGLLPLWGEDPAATAEAKAAAVAATREGMRAEGRRRRAESHTAERRAEQAARTAQRNRDPGMRARPRKPPGGARRCERCTAEYRPTSSAQKYCPDCRPIVERERDTARAARRRQQRRANAAPADAPADG